MATKNEKIQLGRARRILRSEARWLQKAIFALSKAQAEQSKLADARGEGVEQFDVSLDGTAYRIDEVTVALNHAVAKWLEAMRAIWHKDHTLSR